MDTDPLIWQLLLQLILIMLNAVFACAEIAIISIKDSKLRFLSNAGNKQAKRLLSLTDQPAKFLATIQVGITLAGFLGSAFAADNFSGRLVSWLVSIGVKIPEATLSTISLVVITIILSYFTLILGELVPKRIAMRKAEAIGLAMSGMVYYIAKFFAPLVWLLTVSTNAVLKLLGIDNAKTNEQVTEEEIRMMVDEGTKEGAIDLDENEFIHNLFEFDDKTAEDVMTHRTEVTMLWLEDSDEEWEKTIIESSHNKYPICKDGPDSIVGVLNTKYYFRLRDKNRDEVMKNAVRKPYFIPETVRADTILTNMKSNRNHFAVVLDEYGGMSGIVTLSDLLEELVGDIDDDMSIMIEQPLIIMTDPNTWEVSGMLSLIELSKIIGVSLPIDEYETVSGLVFGILGNIPPDGTKHEIEKYGIKIKVTDIKNHMLKKAIVSVDD